MRLQYMFPLVFTFTILPLTELAAQKELKLNLSGGYNHNTTTMDFLLDSVEDFGGMGGWQLALGTQFTSERMSIETFLGFIRRRHAYSFNYPEGLSTAEQQKVRSFESSSLMTGAVGLWEFYSTERWQAQVGGGLSFNLNFFPRFENEQGERVEITFVNGGLKPYELTYRLEGRLYRSISDDLRVFARCQYMQTLTSFGLLFTRDLENASYRTVMLSLGLSWEMDLPAFFRRSLPRHPNADKEHQGPIQEKGMFER